ncbi:MAG: response regulator [Spirochaetales bacterium]|nr:response regulator [Spirochaetales bacterium]
MEKIRILAVDDEADVLKRIQNVLSDYDVTIETSSIKASELIQQETYDLFIIDYQMPDIDGIELLEEIKHKYRNEYYIGIFCTAYGTIHLFKEEIMDGLFTFYLEKPYEEEDLLYIVSKSINKLEEMKKKVKQQSVKR